MVLDVNARQDYKSTGALSFIRDKITGFIKEKDAPKPCEQGNSLIDLEKETSPNKSEANQSIEEKILLTLDALNTFLDTESRKGTLSGSDLLRTKIFILKDQYLKNPSVQNNPELKEYCLKILKRMESSLYC